MDGMGNTNSGSENKPKFTSFEQIIILKVDLLIYYVVGINK